jgi:hypothetical protein
MEEPITPLATIPCSFWPSVSNEHYIAPFFFNQLVCSPDSVQGTFKQFHGQMKK